MIPRKSLSVTQPGNRWQPVDLNGGAASGKCASAHTNDVIPRGGGAVERARGSLRFSLGHAVPAAAELVGDAVEVRFQAPLRGVAPGQAVVLYSGTRVLGSATIDRTARASAVR
jgi:tRNA methyl transferase